MLGLFKKLVDGGKWAGTLDADVKTGIVAAGNNSQANATALTASINVVSTAVAATTDSVRLPTIGGVGESVIVANDDDGTINLFPASGQYINAGAQNAGTALTTGQRALCISISMTKWAVWKA
jgi:hypothetical protein